LRQQSLLMDRLLLVPHAPALEDRRQRPVAQTGRQHGIHRVPERGAVGREHRHVRAACDRVRLNDEGVAGAPRAAPRGATQAIERAFGDHVVEQHGVDPAVHEIRVRMHVVVVRHRHDPVLRLRLEQQPVRHG